MRIIAGKARGRRIFSVSKNLPVKPISDRLIFCARALQGPNF